MNQWPDESWFNQIVFAEDVIECPGCGAWNAYSWDDANMDPNTGKRFYLCGIDGVERNQAPNIYHIPTASGFEWTCGKCRTGWMPVNSPLNAEVYTHNPTGETDDGD